MLNLIYLLDSMARVCTMQCAVCVCCTFWGVAKSGIINTLALHICEMVLFLLFLNLIFVLFPFANKWHAMCSIFPVYCLYLLLSLCKKEIFVLPNRCVRLRFFIVFVHFSSSAISNRSCLRARDDKRGWESELRRECTLFREDDEERKKTRWKCILFTKCDVANSIPYCIMNFCEKLNCKMHNPNVCVPTFVRQRCPFYTTGTRSKRGNIISDSHEHILIIDKW